MKRVQSHMNMSEVTIAYGMTETSPVSTQCATDDPVERRVSTVGQVLPHIEIKIVDYRGQGGAARRDRRVLHPRLLGDEGLLERCGEDRRGDRFRAAGCTPATSRSWTSRATSTSSAG
jgi:acyl-CoA synthetase (AMP-forming)/AMP-acid ligase II